MSRSVEFISRNARSISLSPRRSLAGSSKSDVLELDAMQRAIRSLLADHPANRKHLPPKPLD
jgi:hypothetical protein